ncbi:MAG: J domain-containing protein [Elusimicrobiota bacterium]
MEKSKALISKEKEYNEKIREARKTLFLKERELFETVAEYISMEAGIKKFYKSYYLKELGVYIKIIEDLKNRLLGIKESDENLPADKEDDVSEKVDINDVKRIYRKLAKIYHPDNFSYLEGWEKEFYEFRMGEINEAYEKKDLKALLRLLKKAEIEFGLGSESAVFRLRYIMDDIFIVSKMTDIYKEKKKELELNEIYKLMIKKPEERDVIINQIKERFISDIKIYKELCLKLGF